MVKVTNKEVEPMCETRAEERKVIAFFGAFNPPTRGHLETALAASEQTGLSTVLFVPSRSAYIRDSQGKDFAWPEETRLAMLRKLAESRPWMDVCDWELRQPSQPRTWDTLCHLRETGVRACLLMGSDQLRDLEKGWRHVEDIVREFGIVCVARGKDDCEALLREDPFLRALSPGIRVVRAPEDVRNVSSTEVRRRVAELRRLRAEIAALMPEEILPLLE